MRGNVRCKRAKRVPDENPHGGYLPRYTIEGLG